MFPENLFSFFLFWNFKIYRNVAQVGRETPTCPLSGFLSIKLLLDLSLSRVCVHARACVPVCVGRGGVGAFENYLEIV